MQEQWCKYCGGEFASKRSYWIRRDFCSRKCARLFRKEHYTPRIKHGGAARARNGQRLAVGYEHLVRYVENQEQDRIYPNDLEAVLDSQLEPLPRQLSFSGPIVYRCHESHESGIHQRSWWAEGKTHAEPDMDFWAKQPSRIQTLQDWRDHPCGHRIADADTMDESQRGAELRLQHRIDKGDIVEVCFKCERPISRNNKRGLCSKCQPGGLAQAIQAAHRGSPRKCLICQQQVRSNNKYQVCAECQQLHRDAFLVIVGKYHLAHERKGEAHEDDAEATPVQPDLGSR